MRLDQHPFLIQVYGADAVFKFQGWRAGQLAQGERRVTETSSHHLPTYWGLVHLSYRDILWNTKKLSTSCAVFLAVYDISFFQPAQNFWVVLFYIHGVFFNCPPPPWKCLDWPPLNLLSMRITLRSSRLFSIMGGGQSGTLTFFRNRLLTGQHLTKSRGGQLNKTPCIYRVFLLTGPPLN